MRAPNHFRLPVVAFSVLMSFFVLAPCAWGQEEKQKSEPQESRVESVVVIHLPGSGIVPFAMAVDLGAQSRVDVTSIQHLAGGFFLASGLIRNIQEDIVELRVVDPRFASGRDLNFVADAQTQVLVNDQLAQFADLRQGLEASIIFRIVGKQNHATTISARGVVR